MTDENETNINGEIEKSTQILLSIIIQSYLIDFYFTISFI